MNGYAGINNHSISLFLLHLQSARRKTHLTNLRICSPLLSLQLLVKADLGRPPGFFKCGGQRRQAEGVDAADHHRLRVKQVDQQGQRPAELLAGAGVDLPCQGVAFLRRLGDGLGGQPLQLPRRGAEGGRPAPLDGPQALWRGRAPRSPRRCNTPQRSRFCRTPPGGRRGRPARGYGRSRPPCRSCRSTAPRLRSARPQSRCRRSKRPCSGSPGPRRTAIRPRRRRPRRCGARRARPFPVQNTP